jgi:hypothetical protein
MRYISENEIYALFDRRGQASLHVGDIDVLPRADVAPIIHARWEIVCMNRRKCSNCNLGRNTDVETTWDYCPRCGAKMDLQEK